MPVLIGVDLGGTKLLAGAVDGAGRVLHRALHPARAAAGPDELLDLIARAVLEVRDAARDEVAGVGVGVPCTMDGRTGRAVQGVHQPLRDLPVAEAVAARTGLRVVADNDANAAGVAEHAVGAARGARHAVVLTIGTGIGGALILDGELYRGALGAAGEPGHMVVDRDGPRCDCGSRGCLETLVSGPALARAAGEGDGTRVTRRARAGDAEAVAIVAAMGAVLGHALAGLANLLDPEVIVVGGGVTAATGDLLLGPARAALREHALPPARDHVRVVAAELGEDAGMIGAALLAAPEAAG